MVFQSKYVSLLLILLSFITFSYGAYGPELTNYQNLLLQNSNWNSLCKNGNNWILKEGRDTTDQCASTGYFVDDLFGNLHGGGWTYLRIQSNPSFSDSDQAYSAGYLEGIISQYRIWVHLQNTMNDLFGMGTDITKSPIENKNIPTAFIQFVSNQFDYQINMAKENSNQPFWNQIGLVYEQLQGIFDGYTSVAPSSQKIAYIWFLYLQLASDASDIIGSLQQKGLIDRNWNKHHNQTVLEQVGSSHCSSLVRFTPDKSEIYHAHTTWSSFAYLTRTYKLYELPFSNANGKSIHFASYPAVLDSVDDFYQIKDTKLSVTETTMNVMNTTIYSFVTTQSVPTWTRAIVANRLAKCAMSWTKVFGQANSGTYNNQWMIVDHSLFTPGSDVLPDNLLWIITQAPGEFRSQDVTSHLRSQGYWASYNIPFFEDLWYYLGYNTYSDDPSLGGPFLWSFSNSFRAYAFDNLAPNVATLYDMQMIMTHNNYQIDSYSKNCSALAISARFDISASCPEGYGPYSVASGGFDSKITRSSWMQDGSVTVSATNGPTHQDQTPFRFSTAKLSSPISHIDLPDVWQFPFVRFFVTA